MPDPNNSSSQQQAAPAELPPLPDPALNAPSPGKAAPPAEHAPDELFPVQPALAPSSPPSASLAMAPPSLPSPAEASALPQQNKSSVVVGSDSLFFSEVLGQLREKDGASVKEDLSMPSIMGALEKKYKEERTNKKVKGIDERIAQALHPLQKLEAEWRMLKIDIEEKEHLLHEKEKEIKKQTSDLKSMLNERDSASLLHSSRKKGK
ncbi:hypothetical protein J4460_05510 [Candidatus Woesearchaeota archaeon]|nr:hypothetical protein [Candidatus Woesearchaeota archaeon]HIH38720.1 hypothetical protein [Candidatus Woesearchaeota archaeon]HIH49298.1 hypothetical protein [Candidatus Woesearchaeota archaeon]HIJ03638.1 hypothetical protein [Candidatus Woesearchaeota archaeon]